MYYNARYYDPGLGTFISPDSLVPGAGQVINYNRFLYARGNPLKYTDPNGQEAYCFPGGSIPDLSEGGTHLAAACYRTLKAMGYEEAVHGEIEIVHHTLDVERVYEEVRDLKTGESPSSNPIIFICYSWGCPGAARVANRLSGTRETAQGRRLILGHNPIQVDRMIMYEPEDFLNPMGGIPDNVDLAHNYYAEDAEDYVLDFATRDWVPDPQPEPASASDRSPAKRSSVSKKPTFNSASASDI